MLLIGLHDVEQELSAIMAVPVVLPRLKVGIAAEFMGVLKVVAVKKIIKMR